MCLAVPMRVVDVDGFNARCEARGVERRVSLLLLADDAVAPGDFVVVHLGQALHKVDADEARRAWALVDEMLATLDAERPAPHG